MKAVRKSLERGLPEYAIKHFRESVRSVGLWDFDLLSQLVVKGREDVHKHGVVEDATRHVYRSEGRAGVAKLQAHFMRERKRLNDAGVMEILLGAACFGGDFLFEKGYSLPMGMVVYVVGTMLVFSGVDDCRMAVHLQRSAEAVQDVGAEISAGVVHQQDVGAKVVIDHLDLE